ncbi:MAG: hypothetical protein JXA82_17740 [Sedimentisphaerales bacterium]|nr:hypothetical protein [Sedimentisphaerales bacterium]
MWNKLSQRDRRALLLGSVAIVVIFIYLFAGEWLTEWQLVRSDLKEMRVQLKAIEQQAAGKPTARQIATLTAVPKFEMPVKEEEQAVLFRNEFNEQIKQSGIKAKSLDYLASKKITGVGGYKTLRLQCKSRCNLSQVLDLLGNLNNNPYLVGVEEIQIRPDQRNRQEVDLTLTVSTFAK